MNDRTVYAVSYHTLAVTHSHTVTPYNQRRSDMRRDDCVIVNDIYADTANSFP